MDERVKANAKAVLTEYLAAKGRRKTPERYAILDAVYDLNGRFTIEELNQKLTDNKFPVSHATLFNTLKLLVSLHLVVKYLLPDGIWYEASCDKHKKCYQVCTKCGKTKELSLPKMDAAFEEVRLNRFRRESYVLYIYGLCSNCTKRK